jgi:hypothetical protein
MNYTIILQQVYLDLLELREDALINVYVYGEIVGTGIFCITSARVREYPPNQFERIGATISSFTI